MTERSENIIAVEGVSKSYRIFDRPQDRLKQLVLGRMRCYYRDFWALRDVSFSVGRGEALGIVGRNGSGKSTLLQLIARTLKPTTGTVRTQGKVAALLELGSGFNPEFTGRENVFLNGMILGFPREAVAERLPEILAFADIGSFVDQPVRTYSSGMLVRLAFAVQVLMDPDVLIVDEALAVGDVFFRQKCYERLRQLRERGTAVLLVTHSMSDIEQHCERAIVLHDGQLCFEGRPSQAIKTYYLIEQKERAGTPASSARQGGAGEPLRPADEAADGISPDAFFPLEAVPQFNTPHARCVKVGLCDRSGEAKRVFRWGETALFVHDYLIEQPVEVPIAGLVIHAESGVIVHGRNTLQAGAAAPDGVAAGRTVRCLQEVQLKLAPGEYTFEVGLASLPQSAHRDFAHLTPAQYEMERARLVQVPAIGSFSVIPAAQTGRMALPHHGCVDLPGTASLLVLDGDSGLQTSLERVQAPGVPT
jgi:lipopolysaccharide transport system ATP-binding protein